MGQVKPSRGNKVDRPDLGHGIDTYDLVLRGHCVHHHTVEPALECVIHAGAAVKVHVQDLSYKGVLILGLHDAVAALGKVGTGILGSCLERSIDLAIISV